MRIDILTIFPDYFAPLSVSLLGKARERGVLDVRVHDLREYAEGVHRAVDDTPYGGGPGMLMAPEPWGRALDTLIHAGAAPPLVVLPTPSGRPFTQRVAEQWAGRDRLLICCGRYEGIDARVSGDVSRRGAVEEVSVGDYVLAGGEAAALVIIEAVGRLLPGVVGNPDSVGDDSFTAGLLEGPAYTRPTTWRGLDVPAVLLSGDHARIARWRRDEALRRTAERRPDLISRLAAAGALSARDRAALDRLP
jgi:tRNA (guanine37-N1)-methyltransferase